MDISGKAWWFAPSSYCHKMEVRMTIGWWNRFDLLYNQFLLLCNLALDSVGHGSSSLKGLWVVDGGQDSLRPEEKYQCSKGHINVDNMIISPLLINIAF